MRRKAWALAAVLVVPVVATIGGMIVITSDQQSTAVARGTPVNTAKVEQGPLSAMVTQDGTLTYRARPDGSPYTVINQARGVYTRLPENGDEVACGDVLYRVDDDPVLLLCGAVPAYRDLQIGDKGNDVRQLNRNLHELGYDADAGVKIDPDHHEFTWQTQKALEALQHDKGFAVTGELEVDDAVFLPKSARIAKVTGQLGGFARPGASVLDATSSRLHVQVALDPSEQGQVERGDRAQITLPGNRPVSGRVEGFGLVAQASAGKDSMPADATIPTYLSLDDPAKARGLDRAPVQVDITTKGVKSALSVPVTALVGRSGGGFAVEVVRAGGRRELVAVTLGLFDTGGGRVQVEGEVRAGDHVVVPSL